MGAGAVRPVQGLSWFQDASIRQISNVELPVPITCTVREGFDRQIDIKLRCLVPARVGPTFRSGGSVRAVIFRDHRPSFVRTDFLVDFAGPRSTN